VIFPVRRRRRQYAGLLLALFAFDLVALETAHAASLAERTGRWSCTPVERLAPQIEIDFVDQEYRRCDQNICSAYDLTDDASRIAVAEGRIAILFAPDSRFVAEIDGGRFTEILHRGSQEYASTGACEWHSDTPVFRPEN
jgi:hypothetical protein